MNNSCMHFSVYSNYAHIILDNVKKPRFVFPREPPSSSYYLIASAIIYHVHLEERNIVSVSHNKGRFETVQPS